MNKDYRAYVGPKAKYDIMGANQFGLLVENGLREHHSVLDIGCGSLRAGRLFIPYLNPGNYYGIEPNKWLVKTGIKSELGSDILNIKKPKFIYSDKFDAQSFGVKFDYIIAQSIFTHASLDQISECMKNVSTVMKAKSIFMASFMLGGADYTGSAWVYPSCVKYKLETMKETAEKYEMRCDLANYSHPNTLIWLKMTKEAIK